jgi:hypothetical protein
MLTTSLRTLALAALVGLGAGAYVPAVTAAPDEIVVFTDEFEKKGAVGYELHLNYAARAQNAGLPRRASAASCFPRHA